MPEMQADLIAAQVSREIFCRGAAGFAGFFCGPEGMANNILTSANRRRESSSIALVVMKASSGLFQPLARRGFGQGGSSISLLEG